MAVDNLPNGFVIPTRNEIRDKWQRDYQLRVPGAPTGEGSEAFQDGSVIADTLAPVYANSLSIAQDADLEDMTFEGLKSKARGMGIPELLPASGGTGFVRIVASAGGVAIEQGRELYDPKTSLRFECAVADTYLAGQPVPISGLDTGPTTNLPAGTVLSWRSPPPGLGEDATVLEDSNGDGLTGGRNEESQEELRERIRTELAEAAAAANVADLRRRVKEAGKVLGIPVQEVFVYPGIRGFGTMGYLFTLRPARPGGSRAPTSVQIAKVRDHLRYALPEDDGKIACTVLEDPVTAMLAITWSPGAEGWSDADPWPPRLEGWTVDAVTSPTEIDVVSSELAWTDPQVGQTIAFYDPRQKRYARKRIGAVTEPSPGVFRLVFDTTNNASDTLYAPSVGEAFCPWSNSLDALVEPMLGEFGKLGPGEQVAGFFDAGYLQRRRPFSPAEWPSVLRHKMIDGVDDLPQIGDVRLVGPTVPYETPVGTAAVSANLLTFARLLAFPS